VESPVRRGEKPNALALKRQFNAIKYVEFPWLKEMHRDAHADAFARLGKTWNRFFADLKEGKEGHAPVFKRKGKCVDSFYVANDKMNLGEHQVRLPVIGSILLKESPRFGGKVTGASVIRDGQKWYLSAHFEVEISYLAPKNRREVMGVDLNVADIICSNGDRYETPRPFKAMKRRIKIRGRSVSRKLEASKSAAGIATKGRIPKGIKLPKSSNFRKSSQRLSASHYRAKCIRNDFLHKTTTSIVRKTQATVIEDLSVKGMTASAKGTIEAPGKKVKQKAGLNTAMLDVGFSEFRRQITSKSVRIGNEVVLADRFFPSSKRCSTIGCGAINKDLTLKDRTWQCQACGTTHDRDENAAANLEQWGTNEQLREAFAKVTPVSSGKNRNHESRPPRNSGQESLSREGLQGINRA